MTLDILTQLRKAVLERGMYLSFEDFCERLHLQAGSELAATSWGQWQEFVDVWKVWSAEDLAVLMGQADWTPADILRNEG